MLIKFNYGEKHMNKFKGYLICTDCDGTLTDNEGKVSDANAEAIKYFEEEGDYLH